MLTVGFNPVTCLFKDAFPVGISELTEGQCQEAMPNTHRHIRTYLYRYSSLTFYYTLSKGPLIKLEETLGHLGKCKNHIFTYSTFLSRSILIL